MKQKGGKVLGQGRDGCVIDPPILCYTSLKKLNKVSKIIHVDKSKPWKTDEFIDEFKVGQIFRNYDPMNKYFLPGLEYCLITNYDKHPDIQNKNFQKDLKTCGYVNNKKYRETFINIIMKKGKDFEDIAKTLNVNNFLKSMYYLINIIRKCAGDLKVCLVDLKSPNLLFTKTDDEKYMYPVIIDFSRDFVLTNEKEFFDFIYNFKHVESNYRTWGPEIYLLFSMMTGHDYKSALGKKFITDLNLRKNMIDYIYDSMNTNSGKIRLYEKIMLYSIGLSFEDSMRINKNISLKDKNVIMKIIRKMTHRDLRQRESTKNLLIEINNLLGNSIKSEEDAFIDLNKSNKKKINKSLNGKQMFESSIINRCKKWFKKPQLNPKTGKNIKINGPTYKKLEQECKSINKSKKTKSKSNKMICKEWKKNKLINPRTGRKIKVNGPTYKKLEQECK
jgi:hypothetical protein